MCLRLRASYHSNTLLSAQNPHVNENISTTTAHIHIYIHKEAQRGDVPSSEIICNVKAFLASNNTELGVLLMFLVVLMRIGWMLTSVHSIWTSL